MTAETDGVLKSYLLMSTFFSVYFDLGTKANGGFGWILCRKNSYRKGSSNGKWLNKGFRKKRKWKETKTDVQTTIRSIETSPNDSKQKKESLGRSFNIVISLFLRFPDKRMM